MKSKIFFLLPIFLMLVIFIDIVSATVTIKYFTATTIDLKVILDWEITSESDFLYFVVHRSDQKDGNYSMISNLIYVNGSIDNGLKYHYEDEDVFVDEIYYYKLEAVDEDYKSQTLGPVSVRVLASTYTNTVIPSKTFTVTGTITPNTSTPTPTLNQTKTETPTSTPTSPFSFVTNTSTPRATFTARYTQKPTRTPITKTPEPTRTFEIVHYQTSTPQLLVTISPTFLPTQKTPSVPIKSGAVGFGITILCGAIVLFSLFIYQKIKKFL